MQKICWCSPWDAALTAHDAEVEDAGGGGDAEVEDAEEENVGRRLNLGCSPAYPWSKGMQFEEGLHGEESGEEGVEIMES